MSGKGEVGTLALMAKGEQIFDRAVRGVAADEAVDFKAQRSEEHTSELQSLMRISYAVFCLKKKKKKRVRAERSRQVYEEHRHSKHDEMQTHQIQSRTQTKKA